MIRMTPKISVRPDAISAYMPPVSTPRTAASRTRSISPERSLPVRLRVLGPGDRDRRRVDGHRLAALPLHQERRAVRLPGPVERHRALDRLVRARVQLRDELRVVDAVGAAG